MSIYEKHSIFIKSALIKDASYSQENAGDRRQFNRSAGSVKSKRASPRVSS
jgi:hypothetical protein